MLGRRPCKVHKTCLTAPHGQRNGSKISPPGLPEPDVITRTLSQRSCP